ncbi:MAG: Eco57I restriction-modification methylase domain-containing protein [Bacteroidia bacterium]|nr:Eco57I restriction-modification methylase domain-containing protein [Bacteroidia bacterium]
MSLFQKPVEQKYLNQLDFSLLETKYGEFKTYFSNPEIQENIRNSKEEQFQEGFLRELFVKIFGYTLNPSANFNLTTEYKNIKDSKKADGAVIIDGSVKAVIELKGTETTGLGKIESQAFGYKNNQPDCVYIITSNFEKLRFYIDNAIEFLEFNLFTLTRRDFETLYLCLAYNNIAKGIPKKIKDESVSQEDVITKKLYQDYSLFKRELHKNLVARNPQYDALTLFKKSQKLLDRFLFLFFAEDRQLLPPNSVRLVLNDWKDLQERDVEIPLYDRFKKYFGYLNTGYKGKRYDVYAYNGGLFKPDEILDAVQIDDELLFKHTFKLSEYDFVSEVDVNILGHIFENSLNELDEIKAQLDGQEIDKTKTRRKKEGIFYTPKYITKYIVDNTVGKLCIGKKAEFQIVEEEYCIDKKRNIKTRQPLADKLTAYRNWLLQLTICDPACGSGAFLNQALDFLITEHRYIDELQAKLFGDTLVLSDIEKGILENNLFGVDINEESVEIAKLSLWLRTAQPNRKLNDLNNNIKCGNSLIDDPAVAGDKAFNWKNEFPDIFAKGGFDVVIGNPPYVKVQNLNHKEIDWYKINKEVAFKRIDISIMFFELCKNILKQNGILSFITSSQFLVAEYGRKTRGFILNNFCIEQIIDFGDLPIFDNVLTYVGIFTLSKKFAADFLYHKATSMEEVNNNNYFGFIKISINSLSENNWVLANNSLKKILCNLKKHNILANFAKCNYGIVSGADDIFILTQSTIDKYQIENECLLPLIRANNCRRYAFVDYEFRILYPYEIINSHITALIPIDRLSALFPNTYQYLSLNRAILEKRKDSRTTFENSDNWYSLTRFGQLDKFNQDKIVFPGEQKELKFGVDLNRSGYSGARVFSITITSPKFDLKYLLTVLNSKLVSFYIKCNFSLKQGGYYTMSSLLIDKIPIIEIDLKAALY